MRVLRPLVAFCLAILWTPLTVHCSLEAAGWLGSVEVASNTCCDHDDGACSHDGCSVIEEGDYTTTATSPKLPPPALLGLAVEALRRLERAETTSAFAGRVFDARAPDWIGMWHFERRAVNSPRAPAGSV